MAQRVYLAGPEVFLPDVAAIAAEKKRICQDAGLVGVFPLDADLTLEGLAPRDAGLRIAQANEQLMRGCDLLIANMSPFRGPGLDGGTAYEVGFMRGLGKPVFGYTNDPRAYADRVRSVGRATRGTRGWADADGLLIEDFDLADNLMLEGAVAESRGTVIRGASASAASLRNLDAFRECVERVARLLNRPRA